MKIWIDFINTPQVTFFVPFIREFKKEGHEILLTCRDSGNTIDLLKQYELPFIVIGNKVGKGRVEKSLLFPLRLVKLFFYIRKRKLDIAVSQSSFYQPVIAKILRIPCLYTNDNEHAKGNLFGFLFATKVVLPVAMRDMEFTKRRPLVKKLSYYPSVKEAIYLSQLPEMRTLVSSIRSKIYFRPEPWSAEYYSGPLNFFDNNLIKLAEEFVVVILPRDKIQADHYTNKKFSQLTVAHKPVNLNQIVADCLLFIGAGGSMTREMAVMEVPVISIYQSELLSVDQYLVKKGMIKICPKITYEEIKDFINSFLNSKKEWTTLLEGQQSYSMIKNLIYNLKHE